MVVVAAEALEQLSGSEVAQVDGVVDGVLTVGVNRVHLQTVLKQKSYQLAMSRSRSVVEGRLLEVVFLVKVTSHAHDQLQHLNSLLFVRNLAGSKAQVLVELPGVNHVAQIDVVHHQLLLELLAVSTLHSLYYSLAYYRVHTHPRRTNLLSRIRQ